MGEKEAFAKSFILYSDRDKSFYAFNIMIMLKFWVLLRTFVIAVEDLETPIINDDVLVS